MTTITPNKKRTVDEIINDEEKDWKEKFLATERENQALKKEIESLKAALDKNSDDNDMSDDINDLDDDNSVCDGTPWSVKYFMLKQYKADRGDCMVPFKYPQLGSWVNEQKKAYKKKKLAKHRIDKLNNIGFYWGKGHPKPPTWQDRYEELKTHYKDFGHCNVHVDSDPTQRSALAQWVLVQRKQGRRLQKLMPSSLTREQYKLLDEISFQWKGTTKCLGSKGFVV